MIEFYITGQNLKMFQPVIAADSLRYLTAKVNFCDEAWDGYTRWLHFVQGETEYAIELNENDEVDESDNLNLTTGEWYVYLTGTKEQARLTSAPVILTVKVSGLRDAPLGVIPQTVAEQIDSKASTALLMATAVKTLADSGAFNGEKGDPGAQGATGPQGAQGLRGEKGAKGDNGTTFIPSVDSSGNLSWTNDGGLVNPSMVNIKGAKGEKGDTGAQGATGPQGAQGAKPC